MSKFLITLIVVVSCSFAQEITFKNLKGTTYSINGPIKERLDSLTFMLRSKGKVLLRNGEQLKEISCDSSLTTFIGSSKVSDFEITSMLIIDYYNNKVTFIQSKFNTRNSSLHQPISIMSGKVRQIDSETLSNYVR